MDFESFHDECTDTAEKLRAGIALQQRLQRRIGKSIENGDVRGAEKDIAAIAAAAEEMALNIGTLADAVTGFDAATYLASGDFAEQLVEECDKRGIDIVGEGNSYEIFPYRLKIDPSNEDVLINGRKAPGLRPAAIANMLEAGKAKLLSASFNAVQFAAELAAAYDLAIIATAKGKKPVMDADVYLSTLYKYLTPMRRFRRDYDARAFAFDLARLYSAEDVVLADGRRIQFGPSRNNNRAIRILDAYGSELFIATVRFFTD
ncbi:MAG: hypothetical protein LBL23_04975 [Coriobacteriales bacterium]|nr:hypothetical protein [Coriobacteriales bacterium]